MIERPFWKAKLEEAWRSAPIVWLSGVRRVGKTTLAREIPRALYLNCDLPSTAERLSDPERFYASVQAPVLVMDEVHQLPDPSRLLKIGADTRPGLRILATGSSTLAATQKFRDTLTGRKRTVHLLPLLAEELEAFGVTDLDQRLLRGGLPPALLAEHHDAELYREWLDSYYARDVQELFRVEKRAGFLRLLETILRQSGMLFEVTSLARASGLSRPTILNYLEVLQITHTAFVLRPYHAGGRREILRQPKIYGFDTGFVCHVRGWTELRSEDRGILWEHVVLESLLAARASNSIFFWRDKQQREVDFVLPGSRGAVDTIECKWNASSFDPSALRAFRDFYPRGRNFLAAPLPGPAYSRRLGGLEIIVTHAAELRRTLTAR